MFEMLFSLLRDFFFFAGFVSESTGFPDPLSQSKEKELISLMLQGDLDARDKLIEHNLRLVAHIAKKFQSTKRCLDDLISIGTIGLIKAVNSYNAEKSKALATYASRCIENEILMSLRGERKLANEVSLNEPIGTDHEGHEISLFEVLGTDSDHVSRSVELKIDSAKLRDAIEARLPMRERIIIVLRYGLSGREPLAQREVAELLGISRSYVSRLEKKAVARLRGAFEPGEN